MWSHREATPVDTFGADTSVTRIRLEVKERRYCGKVPEMAMAKTIDACAQPTEQAGHAANIGAR